MKINDFFFNGKKVSKAFAARLVGGAYILNEIVEDEFYCNYSGPGRYQLDAICNGGSSAGLEVEFGESEVPKPIWAVRG